MSAKARPTRIPNRTLLLEVGRESAAATRLHIRRRRVSVRIYFEPSSVCLEVSDMTAQGLLTEQR